MEIFYISCRFKLLKSFVWNFYLIHLRSILPHSCEVGQRRWLMLIFVFCLMYFVDRLLRFSIYHRSPDPFLWSKVLRWFVHHSKDKKGEEHKWPNLILSGSGSSLMVVHLSFSRFSSGVKQIISFDPTTQNESRKSFTMSNRNVNIINTVF